MKGWMKDERRWGAAWRSSGGWSVRWMGCHLTGPAGRLPAPQRCKLVNMEANYCCPCDQGIIQPYHNTRARAYARDRAICADQQRPPSDPVVSPCTLLLNLLNRGQPRPVAGPSGASTATRRPPKRSAESRRLSAHARKLPQQTLLSCTWQHLASAEPPT